MYIFLDSYLPYFVDFMYVVSMNKTFEIDFFQLNS